MLFRSVELLGLLSQQLDLNGRFWTDMQNADINMLGFIIVGLFIATWVIALGVWKFGRIEEKWTKHLAPAEADG